MTVGGLDDQELPHNVIAFNRGPGVLVQNGALFATVRQNSIFANEGPGIESPATTVTAAITSVAEVVNGTTTVTGTIEGLANRAYDLEFFSSEECDPSGFGQGRYFLASSGDEVETDDSGAAAFSATLLGLVLPEAHFFTLTATDRPEDRDLGVLELRLGGFRTRGKTDIPATSSAPAGRADPGKRQERHRRAEIGTGPDQSPGLEQIRPARRPHSRSRSARSSTRPTAGSRSPPSMRTASSRARTSTKAASRSPRRPAERW